MAITSKLEVKFNGDYIELWLNGVHQGTFIRNAFGWSSLAQHAFELGRDSK